MSEVRRGTLYGAGAYLLWGLFPLYFPLLAPATALEVLAHRVVWSLVLVAVLVRLTGRWAGVRAVVNDRPRLVRLALAAVLIAVNWGTYIYGVASNQVVEASLGYFVTPLLSVLLGVVVLRERLSRVQTVAIAVAGVAVLLLTVDAGRPPYLALVLAGSFGTYGLLKKTAGVGPVESLAVETAILAPLALLFLAVLGVTGRASFGGGATGHDLLLASTGVVTVVPLLLFGAATQRVTMTTLGLLQYVTPTLQFVIGVVLRHEPMHGTELLGFGLIWLALAAFTWDVTGRQRRVGRLTLAEAG